MTIFVIILPILFVIGFSIYLRKCENKEQMEQLAELDNLIANKAIKRMEVVYYKYCKHCYSYNINSVRMRVDERPKFFHFFDKFAYEAIKRIEIMKKNGYADN